MAKKKTRLSIFVDGNNFRHGLKTFLKDEHIDWKVFLDEIRRDYDVVQAMYYIGKITHPLFEKEKVKEQAKLLIDLKKSGFIPWLGYFNEDKSEKGVDVQIGLDIAVGAIKKKFDVAMIISGDGDLSNALKIAQDHGVRTILGYIAGTKGHTYRISWILKGVCDSQTALNKQILAAHESWKKTHGEPIKESKIKSTTRVEKKKTPAKKTKSKKVTTKKSTSKKGPSHVLIFSDGGSRGNPGPSGCGAAITDPKGKVMKKISEYIGTRTNNQAEYLALLYGLAAAEEMNADKITCYLDSKLVVEQACNRWKVKNKDLKEYHQQIQKFLKDHPGTSFHYIPREKNKLADQLANDAMDRKK